MSAKLVHLRYISPNIIHAGGVEYHWVMYARCGGICQLVKCAATLGHRSLLSYTFVTLKTESRYMAVVCCQSSSVCATYLKIPLMQLREEIQVYMCMCLDLKREN